MSNYDRLFLFWEKYCFKELYAFIDLSLVAIVFLFCFFNKQKATTMPIWLV